MWQWFYLIYQKIACLHYTSHVGCIWNECEADFTWSTRTKHVFIIQVILVAYEISMKLIFDYVIHPSLEHTSWHMFLTMARNNCVRFPLQQPSTIQITHWLCDHLHQTQLLSSYYFETSGLNSPSKYYHGLLYCFLVELYYYYG